ncbi:PqiB family protein [Pectobacterium punjabense]|uniref:PqiB family protein n=1 Tax=Pectobacterium punjabense TaxID=2108399 RepID=UPI0019690C2D|nr:PqiB family protein [Pectobacterium punjabense]MBN3137169.1 MCE family protein [Pectobacterium punjabense]MCE5379005.1 MCE family protein [Pectobacterium punjabense]
MQDNTPGTPTEATVKNKRRLSPFWLLPLIALMIAGWLIYTNQQERGATVTIDFVSADGIVAGRTPVRYQGVEVGTVQNIKLSEDLRTIQVEASIKSDMKEALRSGTQFWLVTPKASLAGVSGLDALVGGNYIGMMPGSGEAQEHFSALDTQPKYRVNTGELLIHLHADDLGSLNTGSLVYYRKIPVGKVYDYTVSQDRRGVMIDVLIERRFTHLVKKNSRFWNVSGFNADISVSGAKIEMENLAALVNGAIAFDSPEESEDAGAEQSYRLYPDLAQSQRGVKITLDLPSGDSLSEGRTPLMYQGLEVGTLNKILLNPDDGKVSGELIIDPSVVSLMREGTRIELSKPQLSLSDLNVSRLLSGPTLTLLPGEGEPRQHFTVLDSGQQQLAQPGALSIQLTAAQSYGIDSGQPVLLHGVQIGQVVKRTLDEQGVSFILVIEPRYRQLLHRDSKFIVNSRVNVKMGLDGIQVLGASAQEWVSGGIQVLPGSKGEIQARYPLFSDLEKAEEGIRGATPSPTLTLVTDSLPDIQDGSIVLYRKFQVGEIMRVRPKADTFEVEVYIRPEHRKLLTENSVFWAEGGARVQLNTSGLTVQASPLNRALKGAISFDNLEGAPEIKGGKRVLYNNETAARAVGSRIILRTYDASKLAPGMPIRYLGIDIGQLDSLKLSEQRNDVLVQAVLYPEYVRNFARSGTRFSVVTPEISAAGVNHLETLFQPYINVEPGNGSVTRNFELQQATISDSRYQDGLNISVDAPEAGALQVGTPVLFRGIEVGTVTGLSLGTLSDRIAVSLRISKRYQHLVRDNSVFWQASGYNLEFGLVGGVIKSGTFQQFIRGGIAFATPPSTPLAPKAQEGKHFLLRNEEPKEWRQWGTAIPTPPDN